MWMGIYEHVHKMRVEMWRWQWIIRKADMNHLNVFLLNDELCLNDEEGFIEQGDNIS